MATIWAASVNVDDLLHCKAGGIVRCDSPFVIYSPRPAVAGDGAWPDNADFPASWDERDAKV